MLLTIDVGNTNITFGIFDKKALVTTFRMTTKQHRTSDEYGVSVIDMLERNQIPKRDRECHYSFCCAKCHAFIKQRGH